MTNFALLTKLANSFLFLVAAKKKKKKKATNKLNEKKIIIKIR